MTRLRPLLNIRSGFFGAVLGLAIAFLPTGETQADIFNIDLGRSANATTATGFNNITELTDGILLNPTTGAVAPAPTVLSLIDSLGAGSGLTATLTLDNIANDSLGVAGTGADAPASAFPDLSFAGTIPASAFQDGLFLRDEDGDEFVTVTVGGFAANDLVSFGVFGARGNNGIDTFVNVLSGGAPVSGTLNPAPGSTNNLLTFSGLTADANGEIALVINAPGTSQSGTVNFIQFEVESAAVPEPSSAIVGLLGLGLCSLRRRR